VLEGRGWGEIYGSSEVKVWGGKRNNDMGGWRGGDSALWGVGVGFWGGGGEGCKWMVGREYKCLGGLLAGIW